MSSPPETVGELAIGVLEQQTAAFLDRCAGARTGRDPRDVHQMRVAARRMRAALRLFKDLLPPAEATHLNAELKWVAGQLGRARDLDVQLHRLQQAAADLKITAPLAPYAAWLADQRREAQHTLERELISPRFMDLLQSLAGVKNWTLSEVASRPLDHEAARRLAKTFKAFSKRAKRLTPDMPEAEFHKVRIRAKRLRYAAEFFQPVFDKPARTFIKRLTRLQDVLGELQDSVVGDERVRNAVRSVGGAWPAETLLALGQVMQHDAERGADLKREFRDRYEDVAGKAWRRLASNVVMS